MTNTSTPTESWMEFYQQNYPPESITSSMTRGTVTDATVVSTVADAAVGHAQVSRPIRRRPRASKRNPTTVLNTDPANFRAMVQQFTGGYTNTTAPYPMPLGSTLFGFRGGDATRQQNDPSEASYRQFLQLQFQQLQQQQRQGIRDSNEDFSAHTIRNSGSDVENDETFGR